MRAGPESTQPFTPGRGSEPEDPVTPWSGGPMVATGDWDPVAVAAPGSSTGGGSWDPNPPAAHGSSVGRGSRDPNPPAEELPSSCGACGSSRSATSTMLMASEVAAM
jgi:hypothetical protein